jgi:hypothetical protein
MKPIIIILISIYWIILAIVFSSALDSPLNNQGFSGNTNVTEAVDTSGTPTGFFITDVFRLLGLILLGVGLPASTPIFIAVPYMLWSWFVSVLFIVGLVS